MPYIVTEAGCVDDGQVELDAALFQANLSLFYF